MAVGSISARLERLPPTYAMWRRVGLISLGGFFEFYDLFLAAYVAPGLVRTHVLDAGTPGLFGLTGVAGFVAAFFAGLFVGTALFGFVADRLGRRLSFTVSLAWYAVAAIAMATQSHAFGLDLWRFIGGIGIGVELVTIDSYLVEMVPKAIRGRAFAFSNVLQFLSVPLVAFLGWLLVPRLLFGIEGWRIVILIGALGAVVVWLVRLTLPESPRWLAQQGRAAEADAIVSVWEEEARAQGFALPAAAADVVDDIGRGGFAELARAPYCGRALMLIAFNLFQAAGYYGFASWVPTLLIRQGIAVTTSLGYTFIIAIAAPFGPLAGIWFTDRVERKWVIVCAALGIAAAGLAFGAARDAAFVIGCGIALTLANNILSFAYHGYQPELFPTRIRGVAVGFVYSFSRVSTVLSSFVIAAILRDFGAPGVFVFIAGCMGIVALVIGIFGPKTRGRALEEIAERWSDKSSGNGWS